MTVLLYSNLTYRFLFVSVFLLISHYPLFQYPKTNRLNLQLSDNSTNISKIKIYNDLPPCFQNISRYFPTPLFNGNQKDLGNALYNSKPDKKPDSLLFKDISVKKAVKIDGEHRFERENINPVPQENTREVSREHVSYFKNSRDYFLLGLALFVLLAYILYSSYKKKNRANKLLAEKNDTILQQKEELLASAILLKESNKRIHELSQFKENLAHMIVHDMKNPLNSIIGLSLGNPTYDKMQIINRCSTQMLNFVNNMLDIYKFEKTNIVLNLKKHSILELVEEAEQEVQMLLLEKDMNLIKNVKGTLAATFDGVILVRILVNLFTNAIRHSEFGNSIYIEADIVHTKNLGDALKFTIIDNGKGISQEHLTRLFEPLGNGQPQHITKSISTGIGLHFCKLAINAHKGVIEAQSELGKGTHISVYLPVEQYEYKKPNMVSVTPVTPLYHPLILDDEYEPILDYARILKNLKVHEVSKINGVLKKMDKEGIRSVWKYRIKTSVYSGNEKAFKYLIEKAFSRDDQ